MLIMLMMMMQCDLELNVSDVIPALPRVDVPFVQVFVPH